MSDSTYIDARTHLSVLMQEIGFRGLIETLHKDVYLRDNKKVGTAYLAVTMHSVCFEEFNFIHRFYKIAKNQSPDIADLTAYSYALPYDAWLKMTARDLAFNIIRIYQAIFNHETMECIYVDGKLAKNPHDFEWEWPQMQYFRSNFDSSYDEGELTG